MKLRLHMCHSHYCWCKGVCHLCLFRKPLLIIMYMKSSLAISVSRMLAYSKLFYTVRSLLCLLLTKRPVISGIREWLFSFCSLIKDPKAQILMSLLKCGMLLWRLKTSAKGQAIIISAAASSKAVCNAFKYFSFKSLSGAANLSITNNRIGI